MIAPTKRCTACGEVKQLDEFRSVLWRPGRKVSRCTSCVTAKKQPTYQSRMPATTLRKCHDCKKLTTDYRCKDCLKSWRAANHVSDHHVSDGSTGLGYSGDGCRHTTTGKSR